MYNQIPNQRVPLSKKTEEWKKETVEAYMGLADSGRLGRKESLQRLYDYYNGTIHDDDYKYVLEPYGKKRANFPSKMRNYPLIKPTIDLLMGEKSKRPFNYSVIALNADVSDRKLEEKNKSMLENMKQNFINELNAMGVDTQVQSEEELPLPNDLAKMFERSYKDNRAILGQRAMTYIIQEQELKDKFVKAFFHYLVAGEAFTMKSIQGDTTTHEVLNPLNVDYDLDPDMDYIEDGDWAMVTKFMHPSSIIEVWGEYLKPDLIDQIMAFSGTGNYGYTNYTQVDDHREAVRDRLVRVRIVYWQSMKRVGFVTYQDPMTGTDETFEVEDGYVLPLELKEQGGKLEWKWHNEVWEGVVVDEDTIVKIQPVREQRFSMNNPSKNKLPINGRRYSDVNSGNISLVMLGIPFQLNKNVIKYRMELSIARSKDIIAQLDINLIPKKWDMDKFMYHVEGTGIAWVDYNKEGVKLSPNHQSVLDLSVKTISMYVELLAYIDQEWEKVSGVNSQRQGDISQYQGKAMGQQAIVQSSMTTEDMFRKFGGMEKRDMQALLDLSKIAWKNGKNTMYLMPDGTQEFLELDPDVWMEADLGVFVSDASKDVEKMNLARELAMSMAQSGAQTSMVLDLIDEDNFVLMKEKIKDAEKAASELQQAQAQAEQEQAQAEGAQEEKIHNDSMMEKEKDRMLEREQGHLDRQNKLEVAQLTKDVRAAQAATVQETAAVPDDSQFKQAEIGLKQQAQNLNERSQTEVERHNKAAEKISNKPKPSSK